MIPETKDSCKILFAQNEKEHEQNREEHKFLHKRISDSRDKIKSYTDDVKRELKEDNDIIKKSIQTLKEQFDKTTRGLIISSFLLAGSAAMTLAGFLINLLIEALKKKP